MLFDIYIVYLVWSESLKMVSLKSSGWDGVQMFHKNPQSKLRYSFSA